MICNNIVFDKVKSVKIYKNKELSTYFNEYNIETCKRIFEIEELIKQPFFEVPYYIRKLPWGNETVFLPFTDKLFKIVDSNINDTSIQFHPLKNEIWYPLKRTTIYNGREWLKIDSGQRVTIDSNSIHCMKKGGKIFEVQDNILFDDKETIRIYDVNGRKLDKMNDILKHTMPQFRNEIKIDNNNDSVFLEDVFFFLLDGTAIINLKTTSIELQPNKLYFINREYVSCVECHGLFACYDARFYKNENYCYNQ